MYKVTRYHCGYCKKVMANKYAMKKHEDKCWYNPELKACFTCLEYNRDNRDVNPNCEHHDQLLHKKSSVPPENIEQLLFYTSQCPFWIDGTEPEE